MVVVETSRLRLLSTQKNHQNQAFKWKLGRGSRKTIPAYLLQLGRYQKYKWIRSGGNSSLQMTHFVPFSQMTSLVPNLTSLNMPFMAKRFGDTLGNHATAHKKIKRE